MTDTRTFITRMDGAGAGPRLAVKDLIDVAGVPTTAGSRVVAEEAEPAAADAACMAGSRAAGARIVGKTNLVELAFGASGLNPWFGTAPNPLDPGRIPGGSSSGSAVAVGAGEADVAFGTDTGGSVRIPAACCGIVGLKTTYGRVSLDGVRLLAGSLDTVGPMATSVAGVVLGMQLLEPGFTIAPAPERLRVGRVRLPAEADIDGMVDAALATAGVETVDVHLPTWDEACAAGGRLLEAEAAVTNAALFDRLDRLDPIVGERLLHGSRRDPARLAADRPVVDRWRETLVAAVEAAGILVLPTLACTPPLLEDAYRFHLTIRTLPVNLAGLPALALPVPATRGSFPASLQLIGPHGGEEQLVAAAAVIEAALGSVSRA